MDRLTDCDEKRIIDYDQWKNITNNRLIELVKMKVMEPQNNKMIDDCRYGIFKRTIDLPLFHPYFMNYGGNKESFYDVLNTMGIAATEG